MVHKLPYRSHSVCRNRWNFVWYTLIIYRCPTGFNSGPFVISYIYMNDIPNCTEYFNFILYAGDTTLSSTIRIPSVSLININNELAKVYDWLAVNKLSLNIGKTKYVIFHAKNKRIEGVIPDLEIDGIPLDKIKEINFLGLHLNENISWKPHIDSLSNKLAKCAGVLNRLKRFLPAHILRTLYFRMVQSRMMFCLLTWWFSYYRLEKLQKRFVIIVSSSKCNAHSEPLFKALDILKIEHLFSQSCLKFVYKLKKNVNYVNTSYPSNVFPGPQFMITTQEVLAESILFIPVLIWRPNASDHTFQCS